MRAAGAQTRACAQQWGGGPGQNFSGPGNNAKRRATAGLIKRIVSSVWQHTTGTAGPRAWRPTHVYTRLQQQPEPRAATCCVPPVSTTLRSSTANLLSLSLSLSRQILYVATSVPHRRAIHAELKGCMTHRATKISKTGQTGTLLSRRNRGRTVGSDKSRYHRVRADAIVRAAYCHRRRNGYLSEWDAVRSLTRSFDILSVIRS